jgi:DNA-binding transcriptional ArsR family regulator
MTDSRNRARNRATGRPSARDDAALEEAADALGALASEHRVAILRELAAAEEPLRFSELRERVGMRDTGRFNYHLGELRGRFVREADGGYELGHAGERVVLAAGDLDPEGAAALADAYEGATDDDACPVCGEPDCGRVVHVHLSGV